MYKRSSFIVFPFKLQIILRLINGCILSARVGWLFHGSNLLNWTRKLKKVGMDFGQYFCYLLCPFLLSFFLIFPLITAIDRPGQRICQQNLLFLAICNHYIFTQFKQNDKYRHLQNFIIPEFYCNPAAYMISNISPPKKSVSWPMKPSASHETLPHRSKCQY